MYIGQTIHQIFVHVLTFKLIDSFIMINLHAFNLQVLEMNWQNKSGGFILFAMYKNKQVIH